MVFIVFLSANLLEKTGKCLKIVLCGHHDKWSQSNIQSNILPGHWESWMSLDRAAIASESSPSPAFTELWRRVRTSATLQGIIMLL